MMKLAVGEVVEGYRITRFLGRGGFASVFLAQHEQTGDKVALKVGGISGGGRQVTRLLEVTSRRTPEGISPDELPAEAVFFEPRGVRIDLFDEQEVRAMLRAAAGRDLYVMFPLIAEVAEFMTALRVLEMERVRIDRHKGDAPASVQVGAMLEVPGLVWQLEALLPHLDFMSIGSNDLFQFMFATDRGNPRVSDRYDILSPGMLAMIRDIVARCDAAGVPVSLCGEMAGRPIEAMALLGLGIRSLSLSPSLFGAVKAMTLTVDVGELRAYIDILLTAPDHSLRRKLSAYALDHGVVVES